MNIKNLIAGLIPILFYCLLLFLFLRDVINEYIYVGFLFFYLFISMLALCTVRNKQIPKKKVLIPALIIFLFFCYELPLAFISNPPSHIAYAYKKPAEVINGSGIFSLGVNKLSLVDEKNKQAVIELLTRQQVDVLSVYKVDNKIIYSSKNRQLLGWLHLQKDPLIQMENDVVQYLGKEEEWLSNFLNQPDIAGNSAGLSLALAGKFSEGSFQNNLPFAVTGAITPNGEVVSVGLIKEKIQIAQKAEIPYVIIPRENAGDLNSIQKEKKAKTEIFMVSNVDEAVKLIERLNDIQENN